MKKFCEVFGEALLRENTGPEQLAHYSGRKRSTVLSWLNGTLPNTESLLVMCRYLHKYESELIKSYIFTRHVRKFSKSEKLQPGFRFNQGFDLNEQMLTLIGEPTFIDNAKDDQLERIFRYVELSDSHEFEQFDEMSQESSLLVLPEPKIEVIESWSELTRAIAADSKRLYGLSWQKFEDLIAEILDGFGWEIGPMARTKDGGVDIMATRLVGPDVNFNMMVQCKKYSQTRKVGLDVVKDVWATKWDKGFHQAMIATTSTFTKGAVEQANKWGFEMRDHKAIVDYCSKYYVGIDPE